MQIMISIPTLTLILSLIIMLGTKRIRRLMPSEFESRLADVVKRTSLQDVDLGGFERIVPSTAYDEVLEEVGGRNAHNAAHKARR